MDIFILFECDVSGKFMLLDWEGWGEKLVMNFYNVIDEC